MFPLKILIGKFGECGDQTQVRSPHQQPSLSADCARQLNCSRLFCLESQHQRDHLIQIIGQSIDEESSVINVYNEYLLDNEVPYQDIKDLKEKIAEDTYNICIPDLEIISKHSRVGFCLFTNRYTDEETQFDLHIILDPDLINKDTKMYCLYQDYPKELRCLCISLKDIIGHPIQREPLLASIFNELEFVINKANSQYIINAWINYCMHINGKIKFNYMDKIITGIFKGIDQNGNALILNNNQLIKYNGAIENLCN